MSKTTALRTKIKNGKRVKKVGYEARDKGTHRKYDYEKSIKRYKKSKQFTYRSNGSGHKAGEEWGRKKNIDPNSKVTRYGKNSPSFDEGVYRHKELALQSQK